MRRSAVGGCVCVAVHIAYVHVIDIMNERRGIKNWKTTEDCRRRRRNELKRSSNKENTIIIGLCSSSSSSRM